MAYSIKPGTKCFVCKHARLAYQRSPSRYAGPWRPFKTTRSLSFGFPALCIGKTFYFVDGAWMLRVKLSKGEQPSKTGAGVSRLPDIKLGASRDYRPAIRYRRDSEKPTEDNDDA